VSHRFPLAVLLLFFLAEFAYAFSGALKLFLGSFVGLLPFIIGGVLGAIFDLSVLRRVSALNTFFHEWGHAFTALLFFRRIDRFVVTRYRGGEVYHSSGFGGGLVDDVIGLAPYTVPAFFLISVLIRPLLASSWLLWFDSCVGVTFGLHAINGLREAFANWSRRTFPGAWSGIVGKTDIAQRGFVFSFVYIVTMNLAIQGFLLSFLVNGYPGILSWANVVWDVTKNLIIPNINGLVSTISDQMRFFLQ
jgi:hypothetical protein